MHGSGRKKKKEKKNNPSSPKIDIPRDRFLPMVSFALAEVCHVIRCCTRGNKLRVP